MKYKGVIFDFNGTLFWDTRLHDIAWDTFLNGKGISLTDNEKVNAIHGKNNREILENLFGKISNDDIIKFGIQKELIYQGLCLQTDMKLADGSRELIESLHSHLIPYTIATSSGIENVEFYFKNYGLDALFNRKLVVYSDGTIKSKPDPEIFIRAMKILNIEPQQTIIFEDSPAGIRSAENAKAGKIIIVNSTGIDYQGFEHQIIDSFTKISIETTFE